MMVSCGAEGHESKPSSEKDITGVPLSHTRCCPGFPPQGFRLDLAAAFRLLAHAREPSWTPHRPGSLVMYGTDHVLRRIAAISASSGFGGRRAQGTVRVPGNAWPPAPVVQGATCRGCRADDQQIVGRPNSIDENRPRVATNGTPDQSDSPPSGGERRVQNRAQIFHRRFPALPQHGRAVRGTAAQPSTGQLPGQDRIKFRVVLLGFGSGPVEGREASQGTTHTDHNSPPHRMSSWSSCPGLPLNGGPRAPGGIPPRFSVRSSWSGGCCASPGSSH